MTLDISEKWTNGKTKAWTILLIMDKDLGVFHEVSLINSPPTFTQLSGNNLRIKYRTLEQANNFKNCGVTSLLTFVHGSNITFSSTSNLFFLYPNYNQWAHTSFASLTRLSRLYYSQITMTNSLKIG